MEQYIQDKINFINDYKKATNAASGSKYDANANVATKNSCTMMGELHKKDNILINRALMVNKITELFGQELADEYIRQLDNHEIYAHDETQVGKPYCASITMYPFLFNGLKGLGGDTKAPQNIDSFCGSYINLVFAVSAQLRGAVATPEFLMYMDYFLRKAYGDDYYQNSTKQVAWTIDNKHTTLEDKVKDYFQQVVYSVNQPAAARDYQSIFLNWSIFDKYYFESIFGGFRFPDGTEPIWESLDWLQRFFMDWFNEERTRSLLTFPVMTSALLTENNQPKDAAYGEFVAEQLAKGNSFFIYESPHADSLASCCRLRNEISENTFSYSLGAGGVSTGSVNVITMNINRLVQQKQDIYECAKKITKYQYAFREIIQEFIDAGLLQIYDSGFIALKKQFSTTGINGVVEAAESQGITINYNPKYVEFCDRILSDITRANKEAAQEYGFMFNIEMVPAENLGVKNANWDKKDGLQVKRDCCNSYFYIVEEDLDPIEKFALQGSDFIDKCGGGSAYHCNLAEHLDKEQYLQLLNVAARLGCNYWTINVRNTICNDCGHIDKHTMDHCPVCGSTDIDYATRVIGYLKRVSSFSEQRQKEELNRYYA